jgi:hypothetical protein
MTDSEVVNRFESVYGAYSPTVKAMVLGYLKKYKQESLGSLFTLVIENHFVRLGQPCVATIEKIHKAYYDEKCLSLKIPVKTVSATRPYNEPEIEEDDMASVEDVALLRSAFCEKDTCLT